MQHKGNEQLRQQLSMTVAGAGRPLEVAPDA